MRNPKTKRIIVLALTIHLLLIFTFQTNALSQNSVRTEVRIPDIPGYITLKCDFHMHTVFSDGNVWPPVRAEEAWREGLDVFSITDHIELQPHKNDVPTNHNRSYELARPAAKSLNLMIVKGAEITREMPPGHLNAIFLEDAALLDTKDYRDAIKAAVDQGAFIMWNHPGWTGQQPDGIPRWYQDHTDLYEQGWMHGIEIVNEREYYPLVHQWCLEKNLTMIGNSDIHAPINMFFDFNGGEHRPMTLVFAKEKSERAIKDALFARRTAVYYNNLLIGEEKFLKPIFHQSIKIMNPEVTVKGKSRAYIQIHNESDISFELTAEGKVEGLSTPQALTLHAGKTSLFTIRGKSNDMSGKRKILTHYKVKNLLIAPGKGLPVELEIEVTFIPEGTEK